MNLRLSIIILVAGLFMAIWDADQRAIQTHALAVRNARSKTPLATVNSATELSQNAIRASDCHSGIYTRRRHPAAARGRSHPAAGESCCRYVDGAFRRWQKDSHHRP
ncbi:MAG UNVERIFIED_CONTAM: hypothetical protein LVR18_16235 [Planctomycetaceae bacterium]